MVIGLTNRTGFQGSIRHRGLQLLLIGGRPESRNAVACVTGVYGLVLIIGPEKLHALSK